MKYGISRVKTILVLVGAMFLGAGLVAMQSASPAGAGPLPPDPGPPSSTAPTDASLIVNFDSATLSKVFSGPVHGTQGVYTVPAGKWLIITTYSIDTSLTSLYLVEVAPSATTVKSHASSGTYPAEAGLVFDPGSQVAVWAFDGPVDQYHIRFTGFLTASQPSSIVNFNSTPFPSVSSTTLLPGQVKALFTVPGNKSLVITNVTLESDVDHIGLVAAGPFHESVKALEPFGDPGFQQLSYPIDSGLTFPPGTSVAVWNSELNADDSFNVNFTGYLVP